MTPEETARAKALVVSIRKLVDQQKEEMDRVAVQVDKLVAQRDALKAENAALKLGKVHIAMRRDDTRGPAVLAVFADEADANNFCATEIAKGLGWTWCTAHDVRSPVKVV